jgi:hypothetical protein
VDERTTYSLGSLVDYATAWVVYFPLGHGVARLAWAIEITSDPTSFLTLLDAADGTVLFRQCLSDHLTQTLPFDVLTEGNPAPLPPTRIPALYPDRRDRDAAERQLHRVETTSWIAALPLSWPRRHASLGRIGRYRR